MRFFLIFMLFLGYLLAGVNIKRDSKFVTIEVNEPQRGDFKFVLFHNGEPIVIDCVGGVCKKRVELKSGRNDFEWKDLRGLSKESYLNGGAYTIEVFDCKNSKPINSGELFINGKKYQINGSKVTLFRWIEEEIKINPKVKGYSSKGEIKKVAKAGQRDKICLYPMVKLKKEGAIGDPRFNISWAPSYEDIDIKVITPCNRTISFRKKASKCRGFLGKLDIDTREKQCQKKRDSCQENITFDNGGARGRYTIVVNKYKGRRENTDITLTIINNGVKKVIKFTLYDIKESNSFHITH